MRLSIAMATYNGERFIREQLISLSQQDRLPDELVISDDASTDRTIAIVTDFASSAPFEVRIYQNGVNLGYAANFNRAIQECTGDLIFLSDQDDIWFRSKLTRIEQEFASHPEAMLIMNDAEITLGDGTPTGITNLDQMLALGLNDTQFTTGCCMAFSRSFARLAMPVPGEHFVHDTWLNRLSLSLQAKRVVPTVLQYYRRHGDNTSCWIGSRTTKQTQFHLLKAYLDKDPRPFCFIRVRQLDAIEQRIMERNHDIRQEIGVTADLHLVFWRIEDERRAANSRIRVLQCPRLLRLAPASILYARGHYKYFSGWKSFMKDLICS